MNRVTSSPTSAGLSACALALLAAFAIAPGCESSGGSRGESGDVQSISEGILTFHDPAPKIHSRGVLGGTRIPNRRLAPATVVVSTRTKEGEAVDDDVQVTSLTGRVRDRNPAQIFMQAARRHRKVVSREKFAQLWSDLVNAGLLELPRHPGVEHPERRAFIKIQTEGYQVIFLDPVSGFKSVRTEKERTLTKTWHTAKTLITVVSSS